jgi:hypothetical protein
MATATLRKVSDDSMLSGAGEFLSAAVLVPARGPARSPEIDPPAPSGCGGAGFVMGDYDEDDDDDDFFDDDTGDAGGDDAEEDDDFLDDEEDDLDEDEGSDDDDDDL